MKLRDEKKVISVNLVVEGSVNDEDFPNFN